MRALHRLIMEALQHIPVKDVNRDQWLRVGMATKHEGMEPDVWEYWSMMDDPRYIPGECPKLWQGFHGSDNPVTAATIFDLAKKNGWDPSLGAELQWDDEIDAPSEDRSAVAVSSSPDNGKDIWNPMAEVREFISTIFEPDDYIRYCAVSFQDKNGKWRPTGATYDRTAKELLASMEKYQDDFGATFGDYNPEAGVWIQMNPVDGNGGQAKNITRYRYALLEADDIPKDEQARLVKDMNLPVVFQIDSGRRSVHNIVRIDATDEKEYRERVSMLYKYAEENGYNPDQQNRNAGRMCRLPGVMRGEGRQRIIARSMGPRSWDEWISSLGEDAAIDELPEIEPLSKHFHNLPKQKDILIDGILRVGHKMIISGPSKAGKSFLLMELCIALAEGTDWLSSFQCRQGKVLYINLEIDRESCFHRFKHIYDALGLPGDHASNIDIWNLRGKAEPLDTLAPKVISRIQNHDYEAVILDPLYKILTGDENSATEMTQFCNHLDKICTTVGCAVIYCHHYSKGAGGYRNMQDRSSGSGVFARDPDAILGLDMINEKADVVAARKKKHDYRTPWRIESSLREFRNIDPVDIWFDYPVHTLDTTGKLGNLGVAGSPKGNLANSSKFTTKDDRKDKLDSAFRSLEKHPPVLVSAMAEKLHVTDKTIRNYIKEFSDEYHCDNGVVTIK